MEKIKKALFVIALSVFALSACVGGGSPDPKESNPPGPSTSPQPQPDPDPSHEPHPSPSSSPSPTPAPSPSPTQGLKAVILYQGLGSWASDVSDLKMHLSSLFIPFYAVSSLKGVDYGKFVAIIIPGGKAKTQAENLGASELLRLKNAIHNGLNYLGHCAGAFLTGDYGTWGLKLFPVDIPYPSFYPNISIGISLHKMECCSDDFQNVLYYGGPDLSHLGATVLARYRNGAASIVQTRVGNGLVVLTGGHPEVSERTKADLGVTDPDGSDSDLERKLIRAVVDGVEVQ